MLVPRTSPRRSRRRRATLSPLRQLRLGWASGVIATVGARGREHESSTQNAVDAAGGCRKVELDRHRGGIQKLRRPLPSPTSTSNMNDSDAEACSSRRCACAQACGHRVLRIGNGVVMNLPCDRAYPRNAPSAAFRDATRVARINPPGEALGARLTYSCGNALLRRRRDADRNRGSRSGSLKVVIATKLRRGESFTLSWTHGPDQEVDAAPVWLHPSIPLRFVFDEPEPALLSRAWIEALATLRELVGRRCWSTSRTPRLLNQSREAQDLASPHFDGDGHDRGRPAEKASHSRSTTASIRDGSSADSRSSAGR